jgi:putative ABC transport system substrate-binding protein
MTSIYHARKTNNNATDKTVAAVFPVTVDAFTQFQEEAYKVFNKNNIKFKIFSAEGDAGRFQTVIDAALLQNPEVLILVGTQLTNLGLGPKYDKYKHKVIASCISDPTKVDALQRIGISPPRKREVAILTDMPKRNAYDQSAEIISKVFPNINKVGIFYNNSEINSQNTANNLAKSLETKGISIIHGVVSDEDDVIRVVADAIRQGAQLLVIPHDKYVIRKAGAIRKMGLDSTPPIPVFALDDGTVRKDGAAFGVSVDYGYLGKLSADTALAILHGERPDYMDVIQQENANLVINKKTWESLKLPSLTGVELLKLNPLILDN